MPLCGGYWTSGPSREPFRRVADALGGFPQGLLAPGLVDDPATRASLLAHAGVQRIVELWGRLDLALFGIGGPVWSAATIGADAVRELEAASAIGEMLIAPFDIQGRFVGEGLRDRTIALDARELGRIPTTIGVAGSAAKVAPILGALRTGVVNSLVTDVATARAVLDLDRAA